MGSSVSSSPTYYFLLHSNRLHNISNWVVCNEKKLVVATEGSNLDGTKGVEPSSRELSSKNGSSDVVNISHTLIVCQGHSTDHDFYRHTYTVAIVFLNLGYYLTVICKSLIYILNKDKVL